MSDQTDRPRTKLSPPEPSWSDYSHRALKAVIASIPYAGASLGDVFGTLNPGPLERDLFEWRLRVAAAVESLGSRLETLEKSALIAAVESGTAPDLSHLQTGPQTDLTWELAQSMVTLPKPQRYRLFDLKAILPDDVTYLNEPSRRALRLPVAFRERYFVECFAMLSREEEYKRIANGDFHVNLLLSDSAYATYRSRLCDKVEWKPFNWLPVVDRGVIQRYGLELSVLFLGHIADSRPLGKRDPGLYFEVVGNAPVNLVPV